MPADVVLTYLHPNEVGHNFMTSVVDLVAHDFAHDRRLAYRMPIRCGSGGLVEARNLAASSFVADESVSWLLVVDSDMGFAPDSLDRLLYVADPERAPIMGGLCFAWRETSTDGLGGYRCEPRPTIMDWVEHEGGQNFMGRTSYPPNEVVRCAGTGSAFILIHRSVFERIAEANGPTWYDRVRGSDGSLIGEDTSFCLRAGALGIPVYVHTGVRTNHLKQLWVSDADFVALVAS